MEGEYFSTLMKTYLEFNEYKQLPGSLEILMLENI